MVVDGIVSVVDNNTLTVTAEGTAMTLIRNRINWRNNNDNGNNNGGGGETALIINGVQVYGSVEESLEINYTGSFTHFYHSEYGFSKFTDFFTDPVVNVTNGKLTINLGEPNNLMPIQYYFGPEYFPTDSFTFSDPTVKMLTFGDQRMIGNNCNYDGTNNNCNAFLSAYYVNRFGIEDDIGFIYVDKPVTIIMNGIEFWKLRKGWTLAFERGDIIVDFSYLKWVIDFPQNR
jgi:hypothetical protein